MVLLKVMVNIIFSKKPSAGRSAMERGAGMRGRTFYCMAIVLGVGGCGSSDNKSLVQQAAKGRNCGVSVYTAFDPANHAAQDQRTAAQGAIAAKADEAGADLAKAPAAFDAIMALYEGSAQLRAKVQGRADDRFPADPAAATVGKEMDAAIVAAIAKGKGAKTKLDVEIAAETINKTLTRFFYLSVYHELVEGERGTYDEAYGYLGTGPKNDAASVTSVAKTAVRRDANNQTDYAARLFQALLDGSCALDARLAKDGKEPIDWKADEKYASEVRKIDQLMTEVLALSVGHEMIEVTKATDPDDAKVKLHEAAVFFDAIEASMRAKGVSAVADADKIAKMFDDARAAIEAGDATWLKSFDAAFVRDHVASAFGVTVKG